MSWQRDMEALHTYTELQVNPPDYPEADPVIGRCKVCGDDMVEASGNETSEDGICDNCRKDIADIFTEATGTSDLEEIEDFADKFLTVLYELDTMRMKKRQARYTAVELHDILCEIFEW